MAARKNGARKAGAKADGSQAAGAQVDGAQRPVVQPSAGSEDPPMSAAEVRKANKEADEAEAAQGQNVFRVDRGESLPPQAPFPTATDRSDKRK